MSQAVRIAIATRLKNDSALRALLTVHPDDPALPAIFNGTKNQSPPVYGCVTYRLSDSKRDPRFRPALPGAGGSEIEDFTLEMEAWTDQADSAPIDAIAGRLYALFENQAFDSAAGRIFKTECQMTQTDLYDDTLNAWFGIFRFRLRLQRQVSATIIPFWTLQPAAVPTEA